ncbi:MAG: phosphoribosyltransferase [Limisphaerales bacterium]
MNVRFQNRTEAGRFLAQQLKHLAHPDLLVLALPRGGVPIGYEVALELRAPLDVFLVRKLGVPGHEEFAMGAIASGGICFLNEEVVQQLRIPQREIDHVIAQEERELKRREHFYGSDVRSLSVRDRTLILVDDGLATGSSMKVALRALKQKNPRRIIIAVPVAAADTCVDLKKEADEVICARTPEPFYAVGQWYEDFSQTSDEEVRNLLQRVAARFKIPETAPLDFL